MSAGLDERDYLATLQGLSEKAWPQGLPRLPKQDLNPNQPAAL
ncbi:hypothetical protein [Bradyrhizobium campsiandrae]|nr:hypothetical protein [Bradyrhizobium campsiandrae]